MTAAFDSEDMGWQDAPHTPQEQEADDMIKSLMAMLFTAPNNVKESHEDRQPRP